MPGSKPGERRGGRSKGTPNKVSATVKENVIQVFDRLGGVKYMAEWARENPTEFMRLYAKLLPHQHTGEGGGPIKHQMLPFDDAV